MILYLFKSILLAAFFIGIYHLILRPSKQWKFNRYYLLATVFLFLLWPFVNFQLDSNTLPSLLYESSEIARKSVEDVGFIKQQNLHAASSLSFGWKLSLGIYFLISGILLFRFVKHLCSLLIIKPFRTGPSENIYPAKGDVPYSFFNRLYLPQGITIDEKIIKHEKVHILQWHSIDICLVEICLCFLWFNPFLWLFRKAIQENHEFLADHGAIAGDPPSAYLQLIILSLQKQNFQYLANPFSYLSIKNRIKMIQNPPQSNNKKQLVLLISMIATFLVMAAFSLKTTKIETQLNQQVKNTTGISILKAPVGLPIESSKIRKMVSGYGKRTHPLTKKEKLHKGIDLLADEGTPILATASGIVKLSKSNTSGYGKHILIQHNASFSSLYAHLSELLVSNGSTVNQGDTIGIIGTSGTSISVHLHYEIREDDQAVDPLKYIQLETNKRN